MNPIEENAIRLLDLMVNKQGPFLGEWFTLNTELNEEAINDAIDYLESLGAIEVLKFLGTHPYNFGEVILKSRGRFIYNETKEKVKPEKCDVPETRQVMMMSSPVNPVGSPYGFTENDWATVEERKENNEKLYVVLGFQMESEHYDTDELKNNVEQMFIEVVEKYNKLPKAIPIQLEFEVLAAGYGEHLFNEIARNIISSDIAVFDSSDRNSNVMIEIGVALTWDIRVLIIKRQDCIQPPSDMSGQTWADYSDSAKVFSDPEHEKKLLRMVERAARKKRARRR